MFIYTCTYVHIFAPLYICTHTYTLLYHSTPRKRPVLQLCAGCEMAVLAHCLERLSSVAWWPEFSIDNGPG